MKEFCLSTVVYPRSEKFFDDFIDGIESIPEIENARVVVIQQGDVDLSKIKQAIKFDTIEVDDDDSIADVRAFMFGNLKTLPEHKYYIFSDIDDRLCADSFKQHAKALEKADFSYGDIKLYHDDLKTQYDKSLFEISDAPERLNDLNDLLSGHFTGLSAMAMTKRALDCVPKKFPNDIVFVDYWLACSLLSLGVAGAKADTVLDYRLSKSSHEALKPSDDIDVLITRVNEVMKILKHFKSDADVSHSLQALDNLQQRLQSDPQSVLFALKEIAPEWILWCQDVFMLADYFEKM